MGRRVTCGHHHSLGRGGGHPKKRAEDAIFQNVFVMPGVMTIRHDFFDALNGFDEDLAGYEDDDLFVRSLAAGRLRYVPASTLLWRIHPTSASHTQRMVESGLRYWRKLMDRFATGEGSTVIARQLTLRFTRIFLSDASRQLLAGDPLYERNLEAAETLMRHLGVVDRAAFAATRWGWRGDVVPCPLCPLLVSERAQRLTRFLLLPRYSFTESHQLQRIGGYTWSILRKGLWSPSRTCSARSRAVAG